MAMGIEEAVLLSDEAFDGNDAWGTAHVLAEAIRQIEGSALVLTGRQSVDGSSGLVPAGLAVKLGRPFVSQVAKVLDLTEDSITVVRALDEGMQTVRVKLPAVISVSKEINEPRLASFMGIRKASRMQYPTKTAADLPGLDPIQFGTENARIRWTNLRKPPARASKCQLHRRIHCRGSGFCPGRQTHRRQGHLGGAAMSMQSSGADSVLVYVDHVQGAPRPVSWELMGKAREFAGRLAGPVVALIVGHQVSDLASEAIAYGADRVLIADDAAFAQYRAGACAAALKAAIQAAEPRLILVPATSGARDAAALAACALGIGLASDCQGLAMDQDGNLLADRPVFGGNIITTIAFSGHPQMATVRPRTFPLPSPDTSRSGEIVPLAVELGEVEEREEVLAVEAPEAGELGVDTASIIVAGGRGVKGPEGFTPIRELAGGAWRRRRRFARRRGCGLDPLRTPGGADRQDRATGPVHCLRHLGRHPTPGRDDQREGRRGHQQRQGSAHLQHRDLRNRGGFVRCRTGAGRGPTCRLDR